MMTTVISHSFSCSLLNTYFKSKPVKVVDSIADVLAKPELKVAGNLSAGSLKGIISDDNFNSILDRVRNYETKMQIENMTGNPNTNFISKQILQEVLKGETILLINSFLRVIVQDTFADFNLKKGESYNMMYLAYQIARNFSFSQQITIA